MNDSAHHDDAAAIDSHIAKWLTREPEMETALTFAGAGTHRAMLWGALLNEWLEASFTLSDASVALAKLGWWGDALTKASVESPHPLIRALAQETGNAVAPALWQALAEAAMELVMQDDSPSDVAALCASRLPLANTIVAVENALWPQAGGGDPEALVRYLILYQWRSHRPGRSPQPAWLPLQLLARHGLRAQSVYDGLPEIAREPACAALLADLASTLHKPQHQPTGPRLRRIRSQLDKQTLERWRKAHPQPFASTRYALVWQCWKAARGVPA